MNVPAAIVFTVIVGYFLFVIITRRNQYLCLHCGYRFNLGEKRAVSTLICPSCNSDRIAPAPFGGMLSRVEIYCMETGTSLPPISIDRHVFMDS